MSSITLDGIWTPIPAGWHATHLGADDYSIDSDDEDAEYSVYCGVQDNGETRETWARLAYRSDGTVEERVWTGTDAVDDALACAMDRNAKESR